MARLSLYRTPVALPLSWMEELTASGVRCSSSMPVIRQSYSESSSIVRPFNEIPGLWRNSVVNLYNFWKQDGFRNLHRLMLHNFNTFGPIYRYECRCRQNEALNDVGEKIKGFIFAPQGHWFQNKKQV